TPNRGATLEVHLNQPAKAFRLWTADSGDRDFRDDKWSSVELQSDSPGKVTAQIEPAATGFRAYLVEAELIDGNGHGFKLSTEARVIPDGPPAGPSATEKAEAGKSN